MSNTLLLHKLQSTVFADWIKSTSNKETKRLAILTCGYEDRSTHWLRYLQGCDADSCINQIFVSGFEDRKKILSRPANDAFYAGLRISPILFDSAGTKEFLNTISDLTSEFVEQHEKVEIHIDYSCMPRSWYCNLPGIIEQWLRPDDKVFFWYTLGYYPITEYPSAGIKDFNVFSGRASLGAGIRTHLFGLGFDRVRSTAIWSVSDPQHPVCFYAEQGSPSEYLDRVKNENRDLLAMAEFKYGLPLNDFVTAHSNLVDIIRQFGENGDVIIIPDGPKPLVLASSLIPLTISGPGIICFHVERRHYSESEIEPVDVAPRGAPFGFCFSGVPSSP